MLVGCYFDKQLSRFPGNGILLKFMRDHIVESSETALSNIEEIMKTECDRIYTSHDFANTLAKIRRLGLSARLHRDTEVFYSEESNGGTKRNMIRVSKVQSYIMEKNIDDLYTFLIAYYEDARRRVIDLIIQTVVDWLSLLTGSMYTADLKQIAVEENERVKAAHEKAIEALKLLNSGNAFMFPSTWMPGNFATLPNLGFRF